MEMRPESEQGKAKQVWRQGGLGLWGDGQGHQDEAGVAQLGI